MPNNIAAERVRRGLTQGELAEMLNVSQPTLMKWERNPGTAKACYLREMSRIFDCSVDYLMGITDERR